MAGRLPIQRVLFQPEYQAMMTTLLESKPRKKRMTWGTVSSVIFHSALIFFAIYATASAGIAKNNEKREQKVNFVAMKKDPPPPPDVKKKEPPPPPKVKKVVNEHNPPPLPR